MLTQLKQIRRRNETTGYPPNKLVLNWSDCYDAALSNIHQCWKRDYTTLRDRELQTKTEFPAINLYGVPRGGIYAALLIWRILQGNNIDAHDTLMCSDPEEADIIIDDIYDTGATYRRFKAKYPNKPFWTLINKPENDIKEWVVFPWELEDYPNFQLKIRSNHD